MSNAGLNTKLGVQKRQWIKQSIFTTLTSKYIKPVSLHENGALAILKAISVSLYKRWIKKKKYSEYLNNPPENTPSCFKHTCTIFPLSEAVREVVSVFMRDDQKYSDCFCPGPWQYS